VADLQRELVDAVGVLLSKARSALFITGPGVSMDSGLAMYRGIPGLARSKPEDSKLFETALSIETLRRKPEMTWKYLLRMEAAIRAVEPNRAHAVLLDIAKTLERATIMTVNVDRLHQRAGSRDVIEMHGALFDLLCSRCELSTHHESFDALDIPPKCATCGDTLRPDMPLFGEPLPSDPFTRLQAELDVGFDMVFSIGVGTMFPYLARPLLLARSEGIPTIEIGAATTELSDVVDFRFQDTPSKVLGAIWDVTTRNLPRPHRA
jgi:NAD-dependent deacetylase